MPKRRSIAREIRTIRRAITSIATALGRLAPLLEGTRRPVPEAPVRQGRKLRLSTERRAALKLQGQYMGYLRGLRPRQRSQVKALRAAKGFGPAVTLAKKLASG